MFDYNFPYAELMEGHDMMHNVIAAYASLDFNDIGTPIFYGSDLIASLFYPQYVFGAELLTFAPKYGMLDLWLLLHIFSIPFISIVFYLIGRGLRNIGVCKNINLDKPKIFYILLKMIPFIGHFSVIFGALLSEKPNTKRDFKYIILGDILFVSLGLLIAMTYRFLYI